MRNVSTKRKSRRSKLGRGMTLIEIMVVITIIGIIAAAVSIAVVPKLEQAKRETASTDIHTIEGALKLYYMKKGHYPDTATGLQGLVSTQTLDKLPKDPWGNSYVYLNENGKPVVTSYGSDGQPGGDGNAADVSNVTMDSSQGK